MTTKSNKDKKIPQRSCVICRVKADKDKLIRIAKSPDGKAVVDVHKKLQGRGIYICPDSDCIEKAKKSMGAFADDNFWQELESLAGNFKPDTAMKIRSLLGLARKSGLLMIGSDSIERSKTRKILVMTADDCSENIRKFSASYENITLEMNSEELSAVIGTKGSVQIVGLPLTSGLAKKLLDLNIEKGE